MASLTITVADDKVPRILAAYGHTDPVTQAWVPATAVDLTVAIKAWVKSRVIDYETSLAAQADREARSAEVF